MVVVYDIAYASGIKTKDEVYFIAFLENIFLYLFKIFQSVMKPESILVQ